MLTGKSLYLLNDWRNFNEILMKGVTYDNTKCDKKQGLTLTLSLSLFLSFSVSLSLFLSLPFSTRYNFGKATTWGQIDAQAF